MLKLNSKLTSRLLNRFFSEEMEILTCYTAEVTKCTSLKIYLRGSFGSPNSHLSMNITILLTSVKEIIVRPGFQYTG